MMRWVVVRESFVRRAKSGGGMASCFDARGARQIVPAVPGVIRQFPSASPYAFPQSAKLATSALTARFAAATQISSVAVVTAAPQARPVAQLAAVTQTCARPVWAAPVRFVAATRISSAATGTAAIKARTVATTAPAATQACVRTVMLLPAPAKAGASRKIARPVTVPAIA